MQRKYVKTDGMIDAQRRIIITAFAIQLNQLFNQGLERVAARSETIQVLQTVFLADMSGMPISAHKVGLILDMPRTTVIGRLKFLLGRDYITQSGSVFSVNRNHFRQSPFNINKIAKLIIATGIKLQNVSDSDYD